MTHRSRALLSSVSLFVATLFAAPATAQMSYGGVPPSQWASLQMPLQVLQLPPIDNQAQLAASQQQERRGQPTRYGVVVQVGLSADELGAWEVLPSGDLVWRCAIRSDGALSLSAVFSRFVTPPGGELYVHASGDVRTLGAYVDLNANLDGSFAFEPLLGDDIVLEYFEPASAPFHASIELATVVHDFLGVLSALEPGLSPEAAGACNTDVACEAAFTNEERAVVRLLSNGALCTGAMINNTANNGRPYMMTAFHCGSMNNAILYFNYQRSGCNSGSSSLTQTASGTALRASNKKHDYRLTEVTGPINAAFNHFLLGWDRGTTPPSSSVCIHHPSGDVKKISFENNPCSSNSTRWIVTRWDAAPSPPNNVGVTEGGSSGSPLMNQSNGYFRGQLWGGASFCGNPVNDYYGRLDMAWSAVRTYLDPLGGNPATWPGLDP
jgi:lysyl endopeptidase